MLSLLLLLLLCKHLILPAPFIESLYFLHWIVFASLLKIHWKYIVLFLDYSTLYPVQLIYVFILLPTQDYLDYYSFIMSFKEGNIGFPDLKKKISLTILVSTYILESAC